MSEENNVPTPSRGRRFSAFLGRFLKALVKFITFIVLITVIAGAAWLIFKELQRSFGVVTDRVERNSQRLGELQAEIDDLENDLSTRDAQLTAVEAALKQENEALVAEMLALAGDNAERDTMLTALETELAANLANTNSISETLAILNGGVLALQGDVIGNGAEIDELGGNIDGVSAEVALLSGQLVALDEEFANSPFGNGDIEKIKLTLTLYRAWQHLIRAQLNLAEGNFGLASNDIDVAGQIMDIAIASGTAPEALEISRLRILSAQTSLPADPQIARADVVIAWQLLDNILAELLFDGQVSVTPVTAAAAPTETPAGEAEATPTPEVIATPEVTPTPTSDG